MTDIYYSRGAVFQLPNRDIVLQQRDNKSGINSPGLIHVFGGGSEPGETSRQTMEREIVEETALDERYLKGAELIGTFDEVGALPPGVHRNDIYLIPIDSRSQLKVLEGAGHVVLSPGTDLSKLPLSKLAIEVLEKIGFIKR